MKTLAMERGTGKLWPHLQNNRLDCKYLLFTEKLTSMSVIKMTVDKMSVSKMPIGKMTCRHTLAFECNIFAFIYK